MSDLASQTNPVPRRGLARRVQSEQLHTLLIPLAGASLLLPNTAVAEVVNYQAPDRVADAPEWLLGLLTWRDRRIPVVGFEALAGAGAPQAVRQSRIAVLNTLNGDSALPYVAVLTQGIPQLRALDAEALEGEVTPRGVVHARVRIRGTETALIPNLDELERRVLRLQSG